MLRWTERAVADLLAIGDYIAADNPIAARSWVERLRQQAINASKVPRAGRVVPEIGREDIRETFLRTYRIVYRVVDNDTVVLTLLPELRSGLCVSASRKPVGVHLSQGGRGAPSCPAFAGNSPLRKAAPAALLALLPEYFRQEC